MGVNFYGNKANGLPAGPGRPVPVPGEGGAVCVTNGLLVMVEGTIGNNSATNGGGVYVGGGTLDCYLMTFEGNIAVGGQGAAVWEVFPGEFNDYNCIYN